MKKSALFLVQTPLHIQNAHEAILTFGIELSTFLVVVSKHQAKWARMMIRSLPVSANSVYCERDDFDIEATTQSYMQHMPLLKSQNFDYVFFCDTKLYIFTDIVKWLQHPHTYLMDDGAATIVSVYILCQFGHYFEEFQSSVAQRRLEIEAIKRKYDLWDLPAVKYNLFTVFDFDTCKEFEVVQNPMKFMLYDHQKVDHNKILFIGQPLINSGYVNLRTYIRYCINIAEYYGKKEVLYLPHPREEKKDVEELSKNTRFNVIETDLSAESYLVKEELAPATVCGFYSTALWTIAKFHHGLKVNAHRLLLNHSNLAQKKRICRSNYLSELECINLYYQYYEKRMNVIEPLILPSEIA